MINRTFAGFGRWPGWEDDAFARQSLAEIPVDLFDDGDNYVARAELPGVKKSDVNLELDNAVLTLTAEKKFKSADQESVRAFSRSISVGDDVQADKVKATLVDGILTVTMPKTESKKPRTIAVK
jgi:HSP20 family protein